MNIVDLLDIEIVESGQENRGLSLEEQFRQTSPYSFEEQLWHWFRQGDFERMAELFREKQRVGKLSQRRLRQYQYMAVTGIAIAIRIAAAEGVDQLAVYRISDRFIQRVDTMTNEDQIIEAILQELRRLTQMIRDVHQRLPRRKAVKDAVSYITDNLQCKLGLPEIAQHCGVSSSYLSRVFKEEMQQTVFGYILDEKLSVALQMLQSREFTAVEIAALLSFSSQSHFISCFKKKYGCTPGRFRAAH